MTPIKSPDMASETHERTSSMERPDITPLEQEQDIIRRERDTLRQELDAAHTLVHILREREALLWQLFEQEKQEKQLLLAASQSLQSSALLAPARQPAPPPSGLVDTPRGGSRAIIELLRQYPQGLSRKEIEKALKTQRNLSDVLVGMVRYGRLERPEKGIYALPVAE